MPADAGQNPQKIQFPKRDILDVFVHVLSNDLFGKGFKDTLIRNKFKELYPDHAVNSVHFQAFQNQLDEVWKDHFDVLHNPNLKNHPPIFPLIDKDYLNKGKLANFLLASCIIPPLAALFGFIIDFGEMIREDKRNNQRDIVNGVMGALIAGYIGVVCAVAVPLTTFCASNPIGWCLLAGAAVMMGFALLIKMSRIIVNEIVNKCTGANSLLKTDARFQLTAKEEANLLESNCTQPFIDHCKKLIEGLAIMAHQKREYSLFGTKNNYRDIVDMLFEVKKGIIPPLLEEMYGQGPGGGPNVYMLAQAAQV